MYIKEIINSNAQRYLDKLKVDAGATRMYHKIQSVHQEEADKTTIEMTCDSTCSNGRHDLNHNYTVLYRVQDKYWALYNHILNGINLNNPKGEFMSKIMDYRASCFCSTHESTIESGRDVRHLCQIGKKYLRHLRLRLPYIFSTRAHR